MLSLLCCTLITQPLTCLSVSLVVNGPDWRFALLDLQLWMNLATHDVTRMVYQNPCFCGMCSSLASCSTATENISLTNFASASVSLFGSVYTDAGRISGLVSHSGPFSQSSGSSLNWYPLLPTSAGFWREFTWLH